MITNNPNSNIILKEIPNSNLIEIKSKTSLQFSPKYLDYLYNNLTMSYITRFFILCNEMNENNIIPLNTKEIAELFNINKYDVSRILKKLTDLSIITITKYNVNKKQYKINQDICQKIVI